MYKVNSHLILLVSILTGGNTMKSDKVVLEPEQRIRLANRNCNVTIAMNVFLTITQIIVGIVGKSTVLVADAVHTLSDVLATLVVMVGLFFAKQPEDDKHQYGHEKIEAVAAKILAIILILTAVGIGYSGVKKLIDALTVGHHIEQPGMIALWAAGITTLVKEWMYHYTIKTAKLIESEALKADAWHHRSDALSSIAALIGIFAARMKFPIIDPLMGIVIAVFVARVGIQIYIKAIRELLDEAADKEVMRRMENVTRTTKGVVNVSNLRTRMIGSRVHAEMEICVNRKVSLEEAHEIAHNVEDRLKDEMSNVKNVFIHVNPCQRELVKDDDPECINCRARNDDPISAVVKMKTKLK